VNQEAAETVRFSAEESERSPISAYLSQIDRKSGQEGGKVRAAKLTKKRIARRAARIRWQKAPQE